MIDFKERLDKETADALLRKDDADLVLLVYGSEYYCELKRKNDFTLESTAQPIRDRLEKRMTLQQIAEELTNNPQDMDAGTPSDNVVSFADFLPFESPNMSKLPAFPLDSLPTVLRCMVTATADSLQVDESMVAVTAMAVVATAVQGRFIVAAKEDWTQPLNIFAAICARPSERKSPVLDIMGRPLHSFEKAENERRAPQISLYKTKRNIAKKKLAALEEMTSKPQSKNGQSITDGDILQAIDELRELEENEVRKLRLTTTDTTPEALTTLLKENNERMSIISDESGIFDVIGGKYNNGRASLDVFLQGYSNMPLRVDRKNRDTEIIDSPVLSVLLMLQPSMLENVVNNRDFSGRGLLSRFLFTIPKSRVGTRTYNTPVIPEAVKAAYHALINDLLSIPDTGEPGIIRLTPEASIEAGRFAEALEPRFLDDLSDGDIEAWSAKLHGNIMRLAGLLHTSMHCERAAQVPIAGHTMQAAERIGLFFLEHAKVVFRLAGMTENTNERDAKYILKRLKEDGRAKINKRDLNRICQKFRNAEALEPGLAELERRGYIKIETARTGGKGKPPQIIHLNPDAA